MIFGYLNIVSADGHRQAVAVALMFKTMNDNTTHKVGGAVISITLGY